MTTIVDALAFMERNHHARLATRRATGDVGIVSLPDAMELLVDYDRRAAGEHEDRDDYRASMVREQRCVVGLTPTEVGPDASGWRRPT